MKNDALKFTLHFIQKENSSIALHDWSNDHLSADVWQTCLWQPVWPDWAIYCTLGNFSKPVVIIILPNQGVKIFHFSNGFIFGNFYRHLTTFYWSHGWQLTYWNRFRVLTIGPQLVLFCMGRLRGTNVRQSLISIYRVFVQRHMGTGANVMNKF